MAKDEILEWCKGRPAWQQEAIRLLAGQGALEPEQIEQLARAVKITAGIEQGAMPVWPHLTEAHLKTNAQLAPVTLFGSIGPLSNIDRLAADQPPLQFAKEGITLIYGNNGSGKSGYPCRKPGGCDPARIDVQSVGHDRRSWCRQDHHRQRYSQHSRSKGGKAPAMRADRPRRQAHDRGDRF